MNYQKYDLEASTSEDVFEFVSIGSQGKIKKAIQFKQTAIPIIYNLGFGDVGENGAIDDNSITNNGDMEMVLATVATTVYQYTSSYPERQIVFSGSSAARTRLYRMAIAKNYEELNNDFHIFGLIQDGDSLRKVPFTQNVDYFAFIVERKPIIFKP